LEGRGFTTKLHSQEHILYMQLLTIAVIAPLSKKSYKFAAILIMKPILVFPAPSALKTPKSVF
ncbi:MAG: hypothetical protein ACKO7R_03300, partial [Pseudanabaena sp.]